MLTTGFLRKRTVRVDTHAMSNVDSVQASNERISNHAVDFWNTLMGLDSKDIC